MSLDSITLPPLTDSQEMALFNDHDVENFMDMDSVALNQLLTVPHQQQQNGLFENGHEQSYQLNNVSHYEQQTELISHEVAIQNVLPPNVISNEEYPGPFKFEIFIDPHQGTKNPWVYSAQLNKLFITMGNPFPIDFKWDYENVSDLYVRATPLFSLAQHSQNLVTRCIPHSLITDNSNKNIPESIVDHIVRCSSRQAIYGGDVDKKIHLNVLTPLGNPQAGSDTVRLMYTFVCKNSCPSGMNRKPLEVVFTLEDHTGNVYGRKSLSVRVCSCPKRDKEKEEKDQRGGPPTGSGKRRRTDDDRKPPVNVEPPRDSRDYVVQITVTGKHIKRKMLEYAIDAMGGDLVRYGPSDDIQRNMQQIREQLKNMDP